MSEIIESSEVTEEQITDNEEVTEEITEKPTEETSEEIEEPQETEENPEEVTESEFKQAEDEKQALIQQAQIAAQQSPEGGAGLETGINGENTEVL